MTASRRLLVTVSLAFAFGVAAGLFKADQTGLRSQIGNLSAPWLLVAFVPALACRSRGEGARVGLASTLSALAGFYATLTIILGHHLGPAGVLPQLRVEFAANRIYFLGGLVTGPIMGMFGSWVGRRHPRAILFAVGAIVAGETIVVALVQGRQLLPSPVYFNWGVDDWAPYLAEMAIGLAIVAVAVALARPSRTST